MSKAEIVTVSLGVPAEPDGPMPATIFDARQRRIRLQHLSADQLACMGADRTARWTAEYVPGWEGVPARWALLDRVAW